MTRRDLRRPPVNPRPIGPHPHAGQYQVVVTFRVLKRPDAEEIETQLRRIWTVLPGLDIAVREIGATGEASEHEQWPPGSARLRTEDDIEVRTIRDTDTIDPTGSRL